MEETVSDILKKVKSGGDEAVKAYSRKFDGWTPETLELSRTEMKELSKDCDPSFWNPCAAPPRISGSFMPGRNSRAASTLWETVSSQARGSGACTG